MDPWVPWACGSHGSHGSHGPRGATLKNVLEAPIKIRIERIIKRDNVSRKKIEKIIENQWDDKKKMHLSDYFIENISKVKTIKKVQDLIEVFSVI